MIFEEIVELWKSAGVDKCVLTFDCGGDSMGDTEYKVYDKDGNVIDSPEIVNHIDDEIYERVEFYVNSDGYYQGESGEVIITMGDDSLEYEKVSKSIFSEEFTNTLEFELTKEELDFVEKYIRRIFGGSEIQRCLFKKDCILSDHDVEIQEKLMSKILVSCQGYQEETVDSLSSEFFNFTTEINDTELTIEDGKLKVILNQTYEIQKDDDHY